MKQQEYFYEILSSFKSALQSANTIVPSLIVIATVFSSLVILVFSLSVNLRIALVIIIVLIVSIVVFAGTRHYGEAALSLVAGLLTAFSVEWTIGKFIAFSTAWLAFSLLALVISSIKLAADSEIIYKQAALSVSEFGKDTNVLVKDLQQIGQKGTQLRQLGPIARAEIIRLFAYRKIPIDAMKDLLSSVEVLSVVTRVDYKDVTLFMADTYRMTQSDPSKQYHFTINSIIDIIRSSAVPPEDFIKAFNLSKRLILLKIMTPEIYFIKLKENLEGGVAPDDMLNALTK